ncbi:MAG: FCD domain-containing protein [Alphaproteobacteria bacterium]|nr:FCD domain-containing protein [Alphaproteobacteria bacterium]
MRNTVSTRIREVLRRDIESGAFGPDGRFPTERDLADRFGVARNTIRRAMDSLESDGHITRQVGRGTFVTRSPSGEGAQLAATGTVLPADISPRDLIEARMMIEPAAAAAAAANATDADIELLLEAQAASEDTSVMEEFERYDAQIHQLIFAMTHNQLVQRIDEMLRSMRDNADWLAAKRNAYSSDLKARYVAQHAAIIDAVRRRSPRAAREAMIVHLEEVRRALLEG